MRLTQIPFKKTATIFKSEKFISIESLSGASALKYREDDSCGVYLEPEAIDEILGQVLLAALDRSRLVDPRSEREFFDPDRAMRVDANWEKQLMSRYGYKTKRDAYEHLDWCLAKIYDGKISFQPHRRQKPGWRGLPPDRTVVIPMTDNVVAVGAALRLALDRCE
ncbi:MAG: contact-dependent growth inhibition system immunity protein [Xanthobacteraceae bacterium]